MAAEKTRDKFFKHKLENRRKKNKKRDNYHYIPTRGTA